MDLETFSKRLGTPLKKAVHGDDFAGIRNETTPLGEHVVDHTADLEAHPRPHSVAVARYRDAIHQKAPLMRATPHNLTGVSAKALFHLPVADKLPTPTGVLVKPYHEGIHERTKYWMAHPIQGWAEMTNQALWHAADMGHMHQRVHVSEHDMGPGFEKHPALVVHMEPNVRFLGDMIPGDYEPGMQSDALKIGLMDFLSNNIDRHRHNLLLTDKGSRDVYGFPRNSRFLAIDHGRSFQYHAAHKGAPKFIKDDFLGTLPIPEEERKQTDLAGKQQDNMLHYLQSDGIRQATQYARMHGMPSMLAAKTIVPLVGSWWPKVRDRVIDTMYRRVESLKEMRMRQHILHNFGARVNLLDDIAARPNYFLNEATAKDLKVPLHIFER